MCAHVYVREWLAKLFRATPNKPFFVSSVEVALWVWYSVCDTNMHNYLCQCMHENMHMYMCVFVCENYSQHSFAFHPQPKIRHSRLAHHKHKWLMTSISYTFHSLRQHPLIFGSHQRQFGWLGSANWLCKKYVYVFLEKWYYNHYRATVKGFFLCGNIVFCLLFWRLFVVPVILCGTKHHVIYIYDHTYIYNNIYVYCIFRNMNFMTFGHVSRVRYIISNTHILYSICLYN